MLSIVDINKSINFVFSNLSIIILGLIGLGLIIFAIYMKIRDLNFKKNGVPVKLNVKKVEEISKTHENGGKIVNGYKTTFEFNFKGNNIEETLNTTKKFKVGSIKKGIYFTNGKRNVLSVAGEGFYLAKGGEIFMISFGLLVIFLALYLLIGFSAKIVIYVVLIYFILLFGIIYLSSLLTKNSIKKTKKSEIDEIYYSDVNSNEYSTVGENLIRYIPKVKKVEKSKIPFGLIFGVLIFVGLGTLVSIIGLVSTYKAVSVRLTYPSVIGEISDTYSYTVRDEDGESKLVGVIYTYEIDGKTYKLDYKTGKGDLFFNYKIGNKMRLYYDKSNPNNAIPKSEFGTSAVPLLIGILFIYFGVYFIIDDRKKAKLYNSYVRMVEK